MSGPSKPYGALSPTISGTSPSPKPPAPKLVGPTAPALALGPSAQRRCGGGGGPLPIPSTPPAVPGYDLRLGSDEFPDPHWSQAGVVVGSTLSGRATPIERLNLDTSLLFAPATAGAGLAFTPGPIDWID